MCCPQILSCLQQNLLQTWWGEHQGSVQYCASHTARIPGWVPGRTGSTERERSWGCFLTPRQSLKPQAWACRTETRPNAHLIKITRDTGAGPNMENTHTHLYTHKHVHTHTSTTTHLIKITCVELHDTGPNTHTHKQRYLRTQAYWIAWYWGIQTKYTQLKNKMGIKQRLEMDEDSSMEQKTWRVYSFEKRNGFRLDLNESIWRGCLSDRKGKVIPCRWTKNRKGAGINSGESGTRNLEAEGIRSKSLVQGIWRLRVSEAEWRVWEQHHG